MLAIESIRLEPSFEADQAIREGIFQLTKPTSSYMLADWDNDWKIVADSPYGSYYAAISDESDTIIRIWNTETGEKTLSAQHDDLITGMAFSLNEKFILTGSKDGTARLWNLETGEEMVRIQNNHSTFYGFDNGAISSDGKYILTSDLSGTVRLWNLNTRKEIFQVNNNIVDTLYDDVNSLFLAETEDIF